MSRRIGLIILTLCLVCAACAQFRTARIASDPPAPAPPKPAVLSIPLAEFNGSPTQLGTEHGQRFRAAINTLYRDYLMAQLQGAQKVQARLAAASFETYMLPDQRQEITALAQAAGINVYDAMLGQCFLDLLPVTACSTIALPAAASPDGVARMGRNLDFDSRGILDTHSVVIIYHPAGKFQFAAIGWPGMVGVLSGMNEYGLCLANMEVDRPFRAPSAMPYPLLYRMILEQCRTVDQAIDLLRHTPIQSANNLMLMDALGHRAVAELQPSGITIRQGKPGASLLSTNHQRGQNADTPGLCWRYDSLHEASAHDFGRIDRQLLERMLAHVVQGSHGDMTLQSMIFEPATRVVYLATGADAPAKNYERIDLRYYFAPHATAEPN